MDGFIIARRDGSLWCVVVDAEDMERIEAAGPWHVDRHQCTFYVRSSSRRGGVYLHRFIAGVTPSDAFEVDHIDGNGLNNSRSNLRVVTHAEQMQNVLQTTGSSRFRGVTRHGNRWIAQMQSGGVNKHLGIFDDEEEAARIAANARSTAFTHANERRSLSFQMYGLVERRLRARGSVR